MSKNSVFGSSGELVSRLDMLESRKQNLNKGLLIHLYLKKKRRGCVSVQGNHTDFFFSVLDDLKAAFAKVDARMEVLERTPKATPRLLKTKVSPLSNQSDFYRLLLSSFLSFLLSFLP